MHVLLVASEIAPYTHEGRFAEAAHGHTKALRALGQPVTVVTPLYRTIDPAARSLARRLTPLTVSAGGQSFTCDVFDGRTPNGVELTFIHHRELFGGARSLEDGASEEELARRALAFGRAVAALVKNREGTYDVVHAHDWAGAIALSSIREDANLDSIATLLTVRDVESGAFGPHAAGVLELDAGAIARAMIDTKDGPRVSVVAAAVGASDRITATSQSFAAELARPGGFLRAALDRHPVEVVGALDGIDTAVFNPATDPQIPARFDPMDLGGKARCKARLRRELGFRPTGQAPLFGALASAGHDDGFDRLSSVLVRFLRNDVEVAIGWRGDPDASLFRELSAIAARFADRFSVRPLDGTRQHPLLAASDFVVVPSRRAPATSAHMQAHRYGALPIGRRTGTIADVLVDADARLKTGNGFVYDEDDGPDLLGCLQRAAATYSANRPGIERMQRAVMRIDHSWERCGKAYVEIYRSIASRNGAQRSGV
jgi:starch synthase